MAFTKKSLFLVLFLGMVSLSICENEKREEEEEDEEESLEKRDWKETAKDIFKKIGAKVAKIISDKLNPAPQ
ncbi:hypothetical protein GDO81_006477 [Engystomops pustulosus]|uniref:Frog antimicrobial peptide propeptide domain-containing protein n=1 Tax=Engystomops pustulosus TaxID=76066 RepID=A0AAV7CWW1_ENGPU|nr:hypothetical protein GDO81_006477 [Engystomops pustulosus]